MGETGNPGVTPLGAAQMVTDGLAVLCEDAAGLDAGTLAELLLVLEQAGSMTAAARANILGGVHHRGWAMRAMGMRARCRGCG